MPEGSAGPKRAWGWLFVGGGGGAGLGHGPQAAYAATERRPGPGGAPQWVVRAYDNPLARLIFFGPIIMALGGLISLSDRRLRFALPRRAAAPALEPAE